MASVDIKSAVKNYGDVEVLHGADLSLIHISEPT